MVFAIHLDYYDQSKGYTDTTPGWYEHILYTTEKGKQIDAILWLYRNIEGTEKHCRWCSDDDKLSVKFRFEKNYLWFSLSF